jgi:hypothetical protein
VRRPARRRRDNVLILAAPVSKAVGAAAGRAMRASKAPRRSAWLFVTIRAPAADNVLILAAPTHSDSRSYALRVGAHNPRRCARIRVGKFECQGASGCSVSANGTYETKTECESNCRYTCNGLCANDNSDLRVLYSECSQQCSTTGSAGIYGLLVVLLTSVSCSRTCVSNSDTGWKMECM